MNAPQQNLHHAPKLYLLHNRKRILTAAIQPLGRLLQHLSGQAKISPEDRKFRVGHYTTPTYSMADSLREAEAGRTEQRQEQ